MFRACVAVVVSALATASAFQPPSPRTRLSPSSWRAARGGLPLLGPRAASGALAALPLAAIADDGLAAFMPDAEQSRALGVFFAETVISWGVPSAALLVLIVAFAGKRGSAASSTADGTLPPMLAQALGLPPSTSEPKEYLDVERLNEKLSSYEYSLQKATISKEAALRSNELAQLERRLGRELRSFALSADAVLRIARAEKAFRRRDSELKRELAANLVELRATVLAPAGAPAKQAGPNISEPRPEGSLSSPPNPLAELGAKLTRSRVERQIASLTSRRLALEKDFLAQIRGAVEPEQASALAAAFRAIDRSERPGATAAAAAALPGGGALDALAGMEEGGLAAAAAGSTRSVFVLRFFGDVTASQVASLRQEVTAVLRSANASRGDEVVLVLNTGGGTVTGYGLAAAQLLRIKDAALRLTICVEQVAASGGYMMACTADELVANRFAVLGSVGVITEQPNVYERLKTEGVAFTTITAGKYKRTLTPTKKYDVADEQKLREDIEKILALFSGFVGSQRPGLNMTMIATGETWFGADALERGLADRLMTVDELLLEKVDGGAEVLSVAYKARPSPLAALGLGPAGAVLPDSWPGLGLALLGRLLKGGAGGGGVAGEPTRAVMAAPPRDAAEPRVEASEWSGVGQDGESWHL